MSAAIAFLTIAIGISGFQILGAAINQLDLAPQYADVLMGFTNFWGSIGGIVAPYVAAMMTVRASVSILLQFVVSSPHRFVCFTRFCWFY